MRVEYKKGGNTGVIMLNNGEYVATTATKSQWFKTLKGAEKFMSKLGYVQV